MCAHVGDSSPICRATEELLVVFGACLCDLPSPRYDLIKVQYILYHSYNYVGVLVVAIQCLLGSLA